MELKYTIPSIISYCVIFSLVRNIGFRCPKLNQAIVDLHIA